MTDPTLVGLRATLADMRRKYLHAKVIAKTFQETPDWCITAQILARWIQEIEPAADRIAELEKLWEEERNAGDVLERYLAAARKDAERWRHAIEHGFPHLHTQIVGKYTSHWKAFTGERAYKGDTANAAIDAARGKP